MISLGHDYQVKITTDKPLPAHVLDDVYEAVNITLQMNCQAINYDTAVEVISK